LGFTVLVDVELPSWNPLCGAPLINIVPFVLEALIGSFAVRVRVQETTLGILQLAGKTFGGGHSGNSTNNCECD
jgi:hypothetical protein